MTRYKVTAYLITFAFLCLGFSVFFLSYARLAETIIDLILSLCYYFCGLFQIPNNLPITVNDFSQVLKMTSESVNLPNTLEGFSSNIGFFFKIFFANFNFNLYLDSVLNFLLQILSAFAIFAPFIILLVIIIRNSYFIPNTKYNVDTIPLRCFKWLAKRIYQPIKGFFLGFRDFLNQNKYIKKSWTVIWLFNLNIISVIVAFFAFYFYFAFSFDFASIYRQFVKLIIDSRIIFDNVPVLLLIIIAIKMFLNYRISIAQNKLNHMERRNRGFINELPIVSMTVGSMGKKKTTVITDMALSQEVMFRYEALQRLQKADMKFPYFPWICFEKELKDNMDKGTIYNLATVKEWVRFKQLNFEISPQTSDELYGYDYVRYGDIYNDGLKIEGIFDVLETYAKLYFIYIIQSSLMVANYSIRSDNQLIGEENFPLWACDFFPDSIPADSRFAHILDFDVLRLGKKVIENNPNAGSFEFGCVVITEVGKERGNNLELKDVKKATKETNQKNDLFNSWLKMCRHSATVDYFPFIKVFTDEQRPESWGADARELCDIVHIVSSGPQRLALPFYTIEEMLSEWAFNSFITFYYKLRHIRGDNTLLVHILKTFTALIFKHNLKMYNRYGYCVTSIEKEAGTMDGKPEKKKYFLMNQKIYSQRFSTDCFSDYFNDMAKQTNVGLNDYIEYATEKATVEELKLQNSYFIRALYGEDDDNT